MTAQPSGADRNGGAAGGEAVRLARQAWVHGDVAVFKRGGRQA